ncbi:GNAT family N-acetyltransferase [Alicyclobacillus fastidiosus]|uniref:GNAT family N-acetyltransferase n=1 Tax=Alicyclobacillus fastidiosus TaxID=392011 RepID=A0ABY6ZCN9_9BACL|nr:GNAT family N-acetyltransferase [Alicyclobacillus fastidiosus]WAH40308.1 GNAT family N-acetyltransferase [Alicyclobacillus fastidiosus]GMA61687.1 N-acetyltransferase [Alicyclobacillus fastidiosus]
MISVREAVANEMDFIRNQRVEAYEEHSKSIPEGHWKLLKQAISSDSDVSVGVEVLVAEFDGEIVGSVVLCPENTDAYKGLADMSEFPEIRMLAVAQSARNRGVASALIAECIRRAKVKGSKSIGLHTADFMKNAIRLYERIGFERIPQLDFEPANDGIIVKAYRLSIA